MSNQVNLETQNTSQNDEGAMIVQNNEVQNQNKDMKKKELIQKLRIEDLNNENNIFGNSGQLPKINRCLKHPEEDLQFYCFNKDRLLCSECLVSGKYVGSEIANLRKAAEKLRGKFNTFLAEALEKFEAFNLLEEEVVNYEGEMERAISAYEEEISKLFTELRKKINTKEQELLDSLAVVRQERINEFKSMVTSLQDYKEEIDGVKSAMEDELKDLGELELCQHYLDKADIMQDLLHKNLKSEGIKEMIENQQLQDQMSLCKLQEECRSINTQLDNLSGIEIAQCQLNSKETSKPNRMPSFFSSIESDHNNLKESRDTLFLRPSTPSRSNISQKPTYLAEDLTNSGNLSKSPANNLFEKHMAKVHEIRKQTPKQEARIEINLLAPVEAKRSETRNSLMFEMKRNSLNKKFAGLSLNDNSSLLDNYKEILNKKAESKTPKTFMLSSNLTPSNKSLGSDIYSPNNLKTTSLMTSITSITSKAVDRPEKIGFDSSARHMKLDRNIYELQNAELNRRNSTKSTIRENESSKGLNIEKMFGKRKVQEKRPEPSSFVDRGMKKKLDNLSISLFK